MLTDTVEFILVTILYDGIDNRKQIIALMMEAVRTSETSVKLYETTRRKIPEGCHLHNRRHENLKPYLADSREI
jgi:hypothetical protein